MRAPRFALYFSCECATTAGYIEYFGEWPVTYIEIQIEETQVEMVEHTEGMLRATRAVVTTRSSIKAKEYKRHVHHWCL